MSKLESLQGTLLLDSGKLSGSYFDRAVVLVCRHNETGTFGLILNRPMDHTLGSLVGANVPDPLSQVRIYNGGPVQPSSLSFLQETDVRPEYDILPWLTLCHSFDEMTHHFEGPEASLRVQAYAGYAGWASGQLEDEIKRGCWITHPCSLPVVFSLEPHQLWGKIFHDKGGIFQLMAGFPDDPTQN